MAKEMEGIDAVAMATDLDCNDNSPRLTQFHQEFSRTRGTSLKTSPNLMTTTNMCPAVTRKCEPKTSEILSDNTVGDKKQDIRNNIAATNDTAITYSSEDTLNNDFFFDDEFTVPFDANLSDNQDELLIASSDEVLFRKRQFKMTSSKSDSCLYNGDLENSGCDYGNDTSQDLSEKDLQSSGSLPELSNGPLFSPQTSFTAAGGRNNGNESELTNSFLSGSARYDFDWRANKDQYTISFDKNALKCSSGESSLCESIDPGGGAENKSGDKNETTPRLTTWAIQRENSASQGSWATNSSESHSSRRSDVAVKSWADDTNKRPASFQKRSKSEEGGRIMTSWKSIKTPSPGQSEDELGRSGESIPTKNNTSQKQSFYDNLPHQHNTHQRHNSNMITSHEMKENQLKNLHFDISPQSTQQPESASSDYQSCSDGGATANPPERARRRSSPLLELYIRSKTTSSDWDSSSTTDRLLEKLRTPPERQLHPVNLGCSDEDEVSPHMLRKLTGTWSMSTASTHSGCHVSPLSSPMHERHNCSRQALKHWHNMDDLSHDTELFLGGGEDVAGDQSSFNGCQCDLSGCVDCSGSHGDEGTLKMRAGKKSSRRKCNSMERSAQYPPSVNSVSIQTSLQYSKASALSDRYSLIDIGIQTRGRAASEPFSARLERLGNLPMSKVSPVIARNRLTKKILQKKSALPNLSFLKTGLSTSSVLRTTASGSANANKSTKSCQTEIDTDTPPPIPPRMRRAVSASPTVSRESSPANYARKPRSNSVSVCSSSSSGIDPGRSSCESQLNRLSLWSGDQHFGSSEYFVGPHIREWAKHIAINSDRVCIACYSRIAENHQHPGISRNQDSEHSSQDNDKVLKCPSQLHQNQNNTSQNTNESPSSEDDLLKVSLETVKSNSACKESSEGNGSDGQTGSDAQSRDWIHNEPVKLRRPLKSCLRRSPGGKNDRTMKHRSWSDPYDATVLRYSQEGETRYQLITDVQGATCWAKLKQDVTGEIQQTSLPSQASDDFLENENCEKVGDNTEKCQNEAKNKMAEGEGRLDEKDSEGEGKENISPDRIPMMHCDCGTSHAVLHSSSDSGDGNGGNNDCTSRAKKTVSFAEKVSYHSPNISPHPSPKKTRSCGQLCERAASNERVGVGVSPQHLSPHRAIMGCQGCGMKTLCGHHVTSLPQRNPITKEMIHAIQLACAEDVQKLSAQLPGTAPPPKPPRLSVSEAPPGEFVVNSTASSVTSPSTSTLVEVEHTLVVQKQDLVLPVIRASEKVLHYFEKAQDEIHKETMASSKDYPEIGHLVLDKLCPALVAILQDGLRPRVRSVFGKVKNTPWKVMEDSVSQGTPTRVLNNLVKDINELEFLTSPQLKFNAFVFGLLNHRVLDFWLTFVCNAEKLILSHYAPTAFVSLSHTTARDQYLDVTSALQPLAKIPFRLEYNFEYKLVKARRDEALSDLLLHKHTTTSIDARLERILHNNPLATRRPLSVDQALDLLSNSEEDDGSMLNSAGGSSIKDSVQLKMDSLKQYSNAMQDTTEKTKTLLKVTGDSIKEKFKQIQRQNFAPRNEEDGNESTSSSMMGDLAKYLPSSDALFGSTHRSRGRQPMRVPHLKGINDNGFDSQSKDDSSLCKNYMKVGGSSARSQSLDSIPVVKNGEVLLGESMISNKPASRTSSLTDLVGFIGQKIVDLTNNSLRDETAYKQGITSYEFESKQRPNSVSRESTPETQIEANPAFKDSVISADEKVITTASQKTESSISKHKSNIPVPISQNHSTGNKQGRTCASPTMRKKLSSNIANNTQKYTPELKQVSNTREPVVDKSQTLTNQKPVPSGESLTTKAGMFTRRFGLSLINAFDKLLLDPKKKPVPNTPTGASASGVTSPLPRSQTANEKIGQDSSMELSTAVKKSASATEFPKRIVKTLCHHVASEPAHMSFHKSVILTVVKEVDKDWLLCYHDNGRGLVHRGFVQEHVCEEATN